LNRSSWSFSPGPAADDLDRDVRVRPQAREPDHVVARLEDFTGSPSRARRLAALGQRAARMTSWTASGIVMK
jgi:hypothetical protein